MLNGGGRLRTTLRRLLIHSVDGYRATLSYRTREDGRVAAVPGQHAWGGVMSADREHPYVPKLKELYARL